MDAAHHLARQIVERRDIELEGGKGDADGIGERGPASPGRNPRGKPCSKLSNSTLIGRRGALSLQHLNRSSAVRV